MKSNQDRWSERAVRPLRRRELLGRKVLPIYVGLSRRSYANTCYSADDAEPQSWGLRCRRSSYIPPPILVAYLSPAQNLPGGFLLPEERTAGMSRSGKGAWSMLTEFPFDFPGKVFRSSMPFGPFEGRGSAWQAYQELGVDLVVVLTEPQEYLVHAGRDLPAFYRSHGLDVVHLSIPDHGLPPDLEAFQEAVSRVEQAGERGRTTAVHCLAGIGRTGTFLACLAARRMNLPGEQAVRWVREILPSALETPDQIEFVRDFASRGEAGHHRGS